MSRLPCPYLSGEVEFGAERESRISSRHPDLLPQHREKVVEVLRAPHLVRLSTRHGTARLFSRWYADLHSGKHVVVVVMSETTPNQRHWIVTAYVSRRLPEGNVEWQRS